MSDRGRKLDGCRVLVVEDEYFLANDLEETLKSHGASVVGPFSDFDAAYRRAARDHFAAKGMHIDLIKLYGSMELAPLAGLADAIVDLVSTGHTLQANGLVAVEEIMPISARLIVSPAALKLKRDMTKPLLDAIADAAGVAA